MKSSSRSRNWMSKTVAWLVALVVFMSAAMLSPRTAQADDHARALIWEPTPPEVHRDVLSRYLELIANALEQAMQTVASTQSQSEKRTAPRASSQVRHTAPARAPHAF